MNDLPDMNGVIAAMRQGSASSAILEFSGELLLVVARTGSFPDRVASQVAELLGTDEALAHPDTWEILNVVGHFWDDMDASQRAGLLSCMAETFWKSSQEMLQFQIAEFFGEHASPGWIAEWAAPKVATADEQSQVCIVHAIADALRELEAGARPGASVRRLLMNAVQSDFIEVRDEARRALAELEDRQGDSR